MAIKVIVNQKDSFDKTLRIFKEKCREAHIFSLLQKKEHYTSPSERRHRKKSRRSRR
jgi:ribosomal protein S21